MKWLLFLTRWHFKAPSLCPYRSPWVLLGVWEATEGVFSMEERLGRIKHALALHPIFILLSTSPSFYYSILTNKSLCLR